MGTVNPNSCPLTEPTPRRKGSPRWGDKHGKMRPTSHCSRCLSLVEFVCVIMISVVIAAALMLCGVIINDTMLQSVIATEKASRVPLGGHEAHAIEFNQEIHGQAEPRASHDASLLKEHDDRSNQIIADIATRKAEEEIEAGNYELCKDLPSFPLCKFIRYHSLKAAEAARDNTPMDLDRATPADREGDTDEHEPPEIPEYIIDRNEVKPDDWDEDLDGEWEGGWIKNPEYKQRKQTEKRFKVSIRVPPFIHLYEPLLHPSYIYTTPEDVLTPESAERECAKAMDARMAVVSGKPRLFSDAYPQIRDNHQGVYKDDRAYMEGSVISCGQYLFHATRSSFGLLPSNHPLEWQHLPDAVLDLPPTQTRELPAAWSRTTVYNKDAVVSHNGYKYQSIMASLGAEPDALPRNSAWLLLGFEFAK